MRIHLDYGLRQMELELPPGCAVLPSQEGLPAAVEDPAEAVQTALEAPLDFPALRRALTPDDHVAVVVDPDLFQPARLLVPIIEHVQSAQVPLEAITLVCPPSDRSQDWIDDLPEHLLDVRVEVHAPQDRRQLSYVAMMRNGRRLYLNRSVADADQAVVLSGSNRGGGLGGPSLLFPELSDEATRRQWGEAWAVVRGPWAVRRDANAPLPTAHGPRNLQSRQSEIQDAVWLLGAPFFVHVIEGLGDAVAAVIAGMPDTTERVRELADARWSIEAREPVHSVIAAVSGTPSGHDWGVLARAATTAARLVQEGGRIVLVTDAKPAMTEAFGMLRQAETPDDALTLLRRNDAPGHDAAQAWAAAANHARIFLVSDLPADTVEELHAAPIENARQVARLVESQRSCLVLRDAHKVELADQVLS
jgi:nickel-dependent lactate racemase